MTRRKRSKGRRTQLIRLVGLEAAAAMTGVAGAPAMAAPGDLDPSFGDVGRYTSQTPAGSLLWSVDVQPDDAVLFAGGVDYCYYDCELIDFTARLLPNGTPDASFAAATLMGAVVFDTVLQDDGKLVGVGRAKQPDGRFKLLVFRLRPDGSLDAGFGTGGLVLVSDGTPSVESGHSVVVDGDGRIVVAGTRGSTLIVVRLAPNGALDASFGASGVFSAATPQIVLGDVPVRIAQAANSGYRVIANAIIGASSPNCAVFAVTAAGAFDTAFGVNGLATVPDTADGRVTCKALAVQADGRTLLGGTREYAAGYAGRMLPNGAMDDSFSSAAAASQLGSVSAIAQGSGGSLFVAGSDRLGLSGAVVVRLFADGTLDTLFGRAGSTQIDLQAPRASFPTITDMKVIRNDTLIVGGNGSRDDYYNPRMFVARLLGTGTGGGPGVLGLTSSRVVAFEGRQATVVVRRIGGSTGPVAVTYLTRDIESGSSAAAGLDYTTSTGRLTWADGDASDREIAIPIAADTVGEQPEVFEVVLDAPEGGAGLGAFGQEVEIAGEGFPAGQFTIASTNSQVREGGQAIFTVQRNFYAVGAVTVTVRLAGGTATPGKDFGGFGGVAGWQDVVLTWADGDRSLRSVAIPINRDHRDEQAETITLEIVSPTGGANLGATKQATFTVADATSSGGGGGSFSWLGALLFGLWGASRRR